MEESIKENIRQKLRELTDEELTSIYEKHDLDEYTEEFFEVCEEILGERNINFTPLKSYEKEKSRGIVKKYSALEWLIDIFNIVAGMYLVVGIVLAIVVSITSKFGIVIGIGIIIVGVLLSLITKATAEILKIQIDIEENTRKTYEMIDTAIILWKEFIKR